MQQLIGHRNIESTKAYNPLAKFSNTEDFTCRPAKELDAAKELIEVSFEYVTNMDDYKLFRNRK